MSESCCITEVRQEHAVRGANTYRGQAEAYCERVGLTVLERLA